MMEKVPIKKEIKAMEVESPAFTNKGIIPSRYTCDGDNINPPLNIQKIPPETKSLVVIVEDQDAADKSFIHWLAWNIMPSGVIEENSVPGIVGINDFKKNVYSGPCPPGGTHRYYFKVYALDTILKIDKPSSTKAEIEKEMNPYIIAFGEIMGIYSSIANN